MRNVAMFASCLLALAAPVWAQQTPKDKSEDASKKGASETVEVRAYVLNKDRETININEITAMLVVEAKDGTDLMIPLQVITTKTGEKNSLRSSRAPRALEGTAYSVSLMTVRQPMESTKESDAKPQVAPVAADKIPFTLEGPYFKADLTSEQIAGFTCKVSVRVGVKGSSHTAKGFGCALMKGDGPRGAMCHRLSGECALLERHLKANEMDKAGVVVDRISAGLCVTCAEAACHHARHGCPSCCNDLRTAISSGNREKALECLNELKSQCSTCVPPKTESKVTGEPK